MPPEPPTMLFAMCTASDILHAQQSPLFALFPSSISVSFHGTTIAVLHLTPEALPPPLRSYDTFPVLMHAVPGDNLPQIHDSTNKTIIRSNHCGESVHEAPTDMCGRCTMYNTNQSAPSLLPLACVLYI